MNNAHDPEELYQETTVEEMEDWLESCEENAKASNSDLTPWEKTYVVDLRRQFNIKVAQGRKKPLSGNQLQKLFEIYEKS